ncbi:hypothetical protein ILT44_27945 [Microvirga sp. BT689]|uniref:hypothetical protein n=1 Tax=Microvirga arvi TaxID=2778731 RepID=UPI00194DD8E4|nr:hypothetical protein [Microvirga arvi]MBM6584037.1 hypothetical protein [Microvirga arvi]
MIPESAGLTPFGIYVLAMDFEEAALKLMAGGGRPSSALGPSRLLLYHACELYLKAYLRLQKWDVDQLRALNHDLDRMLNAATSAGLKVAPQTEAQIRKATAKNDYVRVRYVLTSWPSDGRKEISPQSLARLTADIRESVRPACDPHGSCTI